MDGRSSSWAIYCGVSVCVFVYMCDVCIHKNRNLKYSAPGWESAYSFFIGPTAIFMSNK